MSGFKEFDHYDGIGLAELVRKKEVSPAELCEEAISRIERVNPKLNAVIAKNLRPGSEDSSGTFA